jgi:serine/threonine protein kinase
MAYNPAIAPADQLLGTTLPDGWTVIEQLVRDGDVSGGTFSTGYIVENTEKQRGFLKAIDFWRALSAMDPATAMKELVDAYLFERNLCLDCAKQYMQNVVVAVAHGSIFLDASQPLSRVQYIIFELADRDIRRHLDRLTALDVPWRLRAAHHISIGIQQLHNAQIAHQDLKPSNVLVFDGDTSKIADLGRAASKHAASPFDALLFPGDRRYAPPESLYNYAPAEWNERRYGCDLYMLGSLVVFLFSRATMNGVIGSYLKEEYLPGRWTGTFHEVLPYLRQAFDASIETISRDMPAAYCADLVEIVQQLCEPDPCRRGHPEELKTAGNRQSVERYISRFDVLAKQAALDAKRGK